MAPSLSNPMFSNPGDEAAIMAAWERFLRGELRPSTALRPLVDVSWQRCQEARVDPNQRSGPRPVPATDLELMRERQAELLEASAPVMACARDFLSETGTVMALADTSCTILTMEGDAPTIDSAHNIQLLPGVAWSEAICGTNAIGTALEAGQPVQIHSAEHYCAGIKRWTCSATVVRHPLDGEILGVVDVSGLSQSYSRQSLALVVTTASRIESRLTLREMERRYRLLEVGMARWHAGSANGLVLFDRRGCPIKANEHAPAAIAAAGGSLDLSCTRRLPGLAAGELAHTIAAGRLPGWMRPEWLEPLVQHGETLGTLLAIPRPRAPARAAFAAATPLREAGAAPAVPAGFTDILTGDAAMREVIARAAQLARSRVPVLLQGETGAGKEEFARGIHGDAPTPFVALNCGGLSRELLASELFGYADGAFTGARKGGAIGKLEAANGGTLFLDEIGELPLEMQPNLLRVLEHGEIYRLGENAPRKVSFRLIAATHRDLRREVAAGRFRMDLYYRIAVTSLRIPPLRERHDDILLLARHFLARFSRAHAVGLSHFAPEVEARLLAYPWPGNVRELRNVVESAVLMSGGGEIGLDMLPSELFDAEAAPADAERPEAAIARPVDAVPAVEDETAAPGALHSIAEGEEALIRRAIVATGGNLTLAARRLDIAKSTLYLKLKRYGLERDVVRVRAS